jgi:predicted DNA-binding ribbon-helix-helix protein
MLLLNPTKMTWRHFYSSGFSDPRSGNLAALRVSVGEMGMGEMGSLKKRSINLAGHATSLALEPEFWAVLQTAAGADRISLAGLIQRIDAGRSERPLASACRVFALQHAQAGATGTA